MEEDKNKKISKQQKKLQVQKEESRWQRYGKQDDWDIKMCTFIPIQRMNSFLFVFKLCFLPQKAVVFTSFSPLYLLPVPLHFCICGCFRSSFHCFLYIYIYIYIYFFFFLQHVIRNKKLTQDMTMLTVCYTSIYPLLYIISIYVSHYVTI